MSPETPAAIRDGRKKHGCQAIMLADPQTEAIESLGIVNQGIHSGMPGGPRLPIPTTVLVDASGVVRWIDQSENYQRRSDPDVVRAALDANLS
jgi:peroxiredoxin